VGFELSDHRQLDFNNYIHSVGSHHDVPQNESKSESAARPLFDLIQAAVYSAIQAPYDGMAQIADNLGNKRVSKDSSLFDVPVQAEFLSGRWHTQQLGSGIGMMIPFALAGLAVRGGSTVLKSAFVQGAKRQLEKGVTTTAITACQAAATGFLFDTLLTPLHNDQSGNFWSNKLKSGGTGAATMGMLSLSGAAITRSFGAPHSLGSRMGANLLSGPPVGFLNAHVRSFLFDDRLAAEAEVGRSMYNFAFVGAGLALLHGQRAPTFAERALTKDCHAAQSSKRTAGIESIPIMRVHEAESAHDSRSLPENPAARAATPSALLTDLTLPQSRPLTELSKELISKCNRIEEHPALQLSDTTSFESWAKFCETSIVIKERDMRLCTLNGTNIEIGIPETYARRLDEVRTLRLAAELQQHSRGTTESPIGDSAADKLARHPLATRLLPEDLIDLIQDLPDRSLIKRINIWDEPSRADPWRQHTYQPNFRAFATANRQGVISFYQATNAQLSGLRDVLVHEWAHLQKFMNPELSQAYHLALKLEKGGGRRYGAKDPEENWAVNSEENVLGRHFDKFLCFSEQAPIRTSIMGRALARNLSHAEQDGHISSNHGQYRARDKYITEFVLPKAREQLLRLTDSNNSTHRKVAIKLIGELGPHEQLPEWETYTIELTARFPPDRKTGELAFNTLMHLTQYGSLRQAQALAYLSNPESPMRHLATNQLAKTVVEFGTEALNAIEPQRDVTHEVCMKAAQIAAQRGNVRQTEALVDIVLRDVEDKGYCDYSDFVRVTQSARHISNALLNPPGNFDFSSNWKPSWVPARRNSDAIRQPDSARSAISQIIERTAKVAPVSNHLEVGRLLLVLAENCRTNGLPGQAISLFERGLPMIEATLEINDKNAGVARNNLALLYINSNQMSKARAVYSNYLSALEQKYGPGSPPVLKQLGELSDMFMHFQDPAFAELLCRHGMETAADPSMRGDFMNRLAKALYRQGHTNRALIIWQDELALRIKENQPNRRWVHLQKWIEDLKKQQK
jgi:hypothetical protein